MGASSRMSSPKPRRGILNRFQTFSYGAYVPTSMDAHFDPYGENTVAGKLGPQMESVPRLIIAATTAKTQPAKLAGVTAPHTHAAHN